jgi:hypothetical protein
MAEGASLRLADAWDRGDFALETAALAFWRGTDLLPATVDQQARARQLSAVAFLGDDVIGVSTLVIRMIPQVRAKLAMFRCAVAPQHRRLGVAAMLAVRSRDLVEVWARGRPEHELKGMGCVVQGAELAEKKTQAVWPLSGLALVGYNNRGEQIRVVWFKNAQVL